MKLVKLCRIRKGIRIQLEIHKSKFKKKKKKKKNKILTAWFHEIHKAIMHFGVFHQSQTQTPQKSQISGHRQKEDEALRVSGKRAHNQAGKQGNPRSP